MQNFGMTPEHQRALQDAQTQHQQILTWIESMERAGVDMSAERATLDRIEKTRRGLLQHIPVRQAPPTPVQ